MAKKTRSGLDMILFGSGLDIDAERAKTLPTYDVLRCYASVRLELKGDGSKQPKSSIIADIVAKKLEQLWQRASLPVLTRPRIKDMILSYNNKYQTIIKPCKSRQNTNLTAKLEKFKADAQKLFDICYCKCADKISCKCEKTKKIPALEWDFIIDQRGQRKMAIGNVDKKETNKLKRKHERMSKSSNLNVVCEYDAIPSISGLQSFKGKPVPGDSSSDSISSTDVDDQDFQWSYSFGSLSQSTEYQKKPKQMRVSLPSTAKAVDLTGVSNRAAAKIVSAVLVDLNMVNKSNPDKVVDKNKIRREIKKNRYRLQSQNTDLSEHLGGLYFDGRKDRTILQVDNRRKEITEEHIALIQEPNGNYFGHLSLSSPVKAIDIANGILSHITKKGISLKDLKVIGCDGTNINTGWKGGVIRLIEEQLGRPLQWAICLLHANELPLRHLLQKIEGHTKGPYNYSGPIGSLLNDCEKAAVVQFTAINCDLPEVDAKDLSTDQQSIKNGNCPKILLERNPGKLAHSRWVTTANRVLRLYASTENPSENLKVITDFIMKLYAPMWFRIKTKPLLQHEAVRNITDEIIERNSYFAQPENVLLAMLTDPREHIRRLAVNRIKKARTNTSKELRVFKAPKLNFDADDYIDIIDWQNINVTEPPITKALTIEELTEQSSHNTLNIGEYPCHTQAVERCVKVITDASLKVCGSEARDGYIRAKIDARKDLPSFENKAQYFAATKD
nr:unnamed protein product [Callosobruchus chinensis]